MLNKIKLSLSNAWYQILEALKSRTVWTLIFQFVMNTTNLWFGYLNSEQIVLANGLLLCIAGYFRINYNPSVGGKKK